MKHSLYVKAFLFAAFIIVVHSFSQCVDWQNNVTYPQGDRVNHGGLHYEAKLFVHLNTPPPNDWFWGEISDCYAAQDTVEIHGVQRFHDDIIITDNADITIEEGGCLYVNHSSGGVRICGDTIIRYTRGNRVISTSEKIILELGDSVTEITFKDFSISNSEKSTSISADNALFDGSLVARQVEVRLTDIPDYVFSSKYQLRSMENLEKFITTEKHLPGVKSAKEVREEGSVNINEFSKALLEKIEELTLYVLQLNKKNGILEAKINQLEKSGK